MVLAIVAIGGCKSTAPETTTSGDAGRLLQQLEAARLATNDAARAAAYFEALELAARDDNIETRRAIIRTLREDALIDALPLHHRFAVNRLHAEGLIDEGRLDAAAHVIRQLVPADKAQFDAVRVVRASWYEAAGQHYHAARELMRVTPSDRNAVTENGVRDAQARRHTVQGGGMDVNGLIWRNLIAVPERLLDDPPGEDVERGWWELARAYLQARSNGEWLRQRRQWVAEHPNHPAAQAWPDTSPDTSPDTWPDTWPDATEDPRNIGLFLPLSGELRGAAEAIRDGFVAAYMEAAASMGADHDAQVIRVYDTTKGIDNALAWAISDGMDVIVGPLDKENVEYLATQRIDIPVIALNRLEGDHLRDCAPATDHGAGDIRGSCRQSDFLHIALAVEDEARAIRHALARRGIKSVAVFESRQHWARRSRMELEAGETTRVVAVGRIDDASSVTDTVAKALGIESSLKRYREVRAFLGIPIQFMPRRRDDVEAIVAFVDHGELMPLSPALEYHYADGLPLFVPSTAIREVEDFGDVPPLSVPVATWQLHPTPLETEAIESLGASKPLLALGVDGYRLANRWAAFTGGTALLGSTGILNLGAGGKVERTLLWAEVSSEQFKAAPRKTVDGLSVDHRPRAAAR